MLATQFVSRMGSFPKMPRPAARRRSRRSRVMLMLRCSSAVAAAAAAAHNTDELVADAITSDRAKRCARI